MGWIYRITSPSGKQYHGQTIYDDPYKRWQQHKRKSSTNCTALSRAILKYGIEKMIFEPLFEISQQTHGSRWREFLNFWEKYEIEESGSMSPKGYNLQSGGKNYTVSEETRARISTKAKLRRLSEETKLRLKRTPEQRKHLSLVMLAQKRKLTPQHRSAISKAQKGRFVSEKTRERKKAAWDVLCQTPGFLEVRKKKTADFNKRTKSKPVLQFNLEGILIKEYSSIRHASNVTNVDASTISRCTKGTQKTAGGFIWTLINDGE